RGHCEEGGGTHAKYAVDAGDDAMPVYYSRIACKFQGPHINLWPKLGEWDLISENYKFCQALGIEAHTSGLGAFVTPSARDHSTGSCVSAFVEGTIGNVVVTGTARFTYDAEAMTFVVTMI